jgi:hypothetical protein
MTTVIVCRPAAAAARANRPTTKTADDTGVDGNRTSVGVWFSKRAATSALGTHGGWAGWRGAVLDCLTLRINIIVVVIIIIIIIITSSSTIVRAPRRAPLMAPRWRAWVSATRSLAQEYG